MNDNSLAKSQVLGVLDGNTVTKRDALNKRDRVDFFRFTLNRSSNVNFKLAGLRANADLSLLDSTGKNIVRSAKPGNKAEKVQRQLAAGTYYVQVRGNGGATKYKLKGSGVAVGGGGGGATPGAGTAGNPIDLGTLTGAPVSRSQDTAGLRDENKLYYKFQMGQIGEVNFRMSQVTGSGRVSLYYDSNRNGKWDFEDRTLNFGVAEGSASNNSTESEVLPVAGTYFLVGSSDNLTSNVRYDLLLTPTLVPGNLPTDPGPEETTAYDLGTLNKGGTFEIKDQIGQVDEKDVFKFNLSAAGRVTYKKLETIGDKFSVYSDLVYDKNGNGLKDSTDQLFPFANVTDGFYDLQAGNYFLFVERGDAAYSINLTAS
jgi:Bacterial pre-peptidase C-terminal domain